MTTLPAEDVDLIIMSPQQFLQLLDEGSRKIPGAASRFMTQSSTPGTSINPLSTIDRGNEWLKNKTHVDMFGWKDAMVDGRTAFRQISVLGITGDAYLSKTRTGAEAVVLRGYAGLREKLPGTKYLRDHPVIKEIGLVVGRKEMLEEAGKATKIGVVVFIAWDTAHELLQDKPDITHLSVGILSDILQCVTATYAGVVIGLVAASFGAPVVFTFCVVAGTTFALGAGLDWIDKHYKLTDGAVELAKKLEESKPIESFVRIVEDAGKRYLQYMGSAPTLCLAY